MVGRTSEGIVTASCMKISKNFVLAAITSVFVKVFRKKERNVTGTVAQCSHV
jgi:hypothetical protein